MSIKITKQVNYTNRRQDTWLQNRIALIPFRLMFRLCPWWQQRKGWTMHPTCCAQPHQGSHRQYEPNKLSLTQKQDCKWLLRLKHLRPKWKSITIAFRLLSDVSPQTVPCRQCYAEAVAPSLVSPHRPNSPCAPSMRAVSFFCSDWTSCRSASILSCFL